MQADKIRSYHGSEYVIEKRTNGYANAYDLDICDWKFCS